MKRRKKCGWCSEMLARCEFAKGHTFCRGCEAIHEALRALNRENKRRADKVGEDA